MQENTPGTNTSHKDGNDTPRKITHDLNNAIAAIVGSADLALLKVPESDPAYKYLKQISISADKATELTHRLLTILPRDNPQE